jgi:ADP-heptose:LPS heptosyltransferase
MTGSFRLAVNLFRGLKILPNKSQRPDTFLVVHLTSHLGDTILLMPLLSALRAAHPNARIEVAIESAAAPLLQRVPELDHVYSLPLTREPPVTISQSLRRVLEVCTSYWRQMRSCSAAVCLSPRWDNDQYRSHVLAYLVGSQRRIGFTWNSMPGFRAAPYRDKLLTEAISGASGMHEAARFCYLASTAGLIAPQQPVTAAVPALQSVAAGVDWPSLTQRLGIDSSQPFAVIAPGASMPRRIWPVAKWAHICRALSERGLNVILLSGPSDAAVAQELHEASGRIGLLLAGQTNLLESTAIVSHASLFLGSDSGPGHVACALGTPTVVLFASAPGCDPNDPSAAARLHPLGPLLEYCSPSRNLDPCSGPCHATEPHCITLIQPQDVLQAVDAVLARAGNNKLTTAVANPLSTAGRPSLAR